MLSRLTIIAVLYISLIVPAFASRNKSQWTNQASPRGSDCQPSVTTPTPTPSSISGEWYRGQGATGSWTANLRDGNIQDSDPWTSSITSSMGPSEYEWNPWSSSVAPTNTAPSSPPWSGTCPSPSTVTSWATTYPSTCPPLTCSSTCPSVSISTTTVTVTASTTITTTENITDTATSDTTTTTTTTTTSPTTSTTTVTSPTTTTTTTTSLSTTTTTTTTTSSSTTTSGSGACPTGTSSEQGGGCGQCTFNIYCGQTLTAEDDNPSWDIVNQPNFQACLDQCDSNQQCSAFTYNEVTTECRQFFDQTEVTLSSAPGIDSGIYVANSCKNNDCPGYQCPNVNEPECPS